MKGQLTVVTRTAGLLRGRQPPLPAEEERAAAEQALAEEAGERGHL